MPRYFLIVSLSFAIISGPATFAQGRASDALFARLTFRLDEENFIIFLPEEARHPNAGIGINRVVFSLTKRQRRRTLHLTTATEAGAEYTHRLRMTSGSLLEFKVKDDTRDGSSGPIAELAGRMSVGQHVLYVLCTDQDKVNLEPDWCLPYLNSLKIVKRVP